MNFWLWLVAQLVLPPAITTLVVVALHLTGVPAP